ncbi:glycosyltransferase family 22 protein [[Candida] arabinofermentans NRRL YB-2248]|uniref:Mannosyltransferase n=1 Tax=[Candida] arabinofermentans NRRL YB-2248 TaxID=983967 RepID=A0A1E4T274_9ASCO|nr:glycosyltransferase family 22 protein [[Candida] arabinofermentans NRRL YB-2248]
MESVEKKKDISEATDEEIKELAAQFVKENFKKSSLASLSLLHWRNIYLLFSIIFRIVVALQTSYIHPDEFFQSFQPIYHDNIPWEFEEGCRSMAPLYLLYYPVIYIGQWFEMRPIVIYYLVKLTFCFLSWAVLDFCIFRIMPIKQERLKAMFFMNTSYVTLVYQSHTFSNSIETILVVAAIWIINDVRNHLELGNKIYSTSRLIMLGFLVSFGLFNRPTFILWMILPSVFVLKYAMRSFRGITLLIASFTVTTISCILIDTHHFRGSIDLSNISSLYDLNTRLVITPLNNILYNSSISNLKTHGLHPYYTHILINTPQILGPLIFLLPPFQSTQYIRTTPFLSMISGLVALSLIPHQELRFLIPMVPLAACCISIPKHKFTKWIIQLSVVFNLAMMVLMGVLHQGGLVPALEYIHDLKFTGKPEGNILLFWRTYKPPTWLTLSDADEERPIYLNNDQNNLTSIVDMKLSGACYTIDFMGMEFVEFENVAKNIVEKYTDRDIYLVTPLNAALNFENNTNFEKVWSYGWHLDLDHFEIEKFGIASLKPGIAIYKLGLF